MAKSDRLMHALAMQRLSNRKHPLWQGQLRLGDRWATWQGELGDGDFHRHFAAQAIFSDRPVRVFDAHGRHVEALCVLVDPLARHKIEAGGEALLLYIEPGRHVGPEAEELLRPVRRASSFAILDSAEGGQFWAPWLASPPTVENALDPRLISALERVESWLPLGSVPLQAAAGASGLSTERFRHVFAEQIGVPYKRYVLWRRLRLAAVGLAAGHDVTTAAHGAGFSDSAHFARTLKSTFGITASQALTRQ